MFSSIINSMWFRKKSPSETKDSVLQLHILAIIITHKIFVKYILYTIISFKNTLLFCLSRFLITISAAFVFMHSFTFLYLGFKTITSYSKFRARLCIFSAPNLPYTKQCCQCRQGEKPQSRPKTSNPRFIFLTCRPQRQHKISQKNSHFFTILIFLFLYSSWVPRKVSYETTENSAPLEITAPMPGHKGAPALAGNLAVTQTETEIPSEGWRVKVSHAKLRWDEG